MIYKFSMKREDYVYMDCRIRMSQKAMADLLYAAIITHAGLPTSYGTGIYEYTRKQNSFNCALVKVHIHPDMIPTFEEYSGVTLEKPQSVTIN